MKCHAANVKTQHANMQEQTLPCSSDASTVNMEHCRQENDADYA